MESGNVFMLFLLTSGISSQELPPPDPGSPPGGIMSNIFMWADAARPVFPIDAQAAGTAETGLPPEPSLPDIGPGSPVASNLDLPPEPPLQDQRPVQGQDPTLSGHKLTPQVDNRPKQPPSTDVLVSPLELPPDAQLLGLPDPNQGLPAFADTQDPNQGLLAGVNLDSDIIDPSLLFPEDTANVLLPKPGLENNDFMINFLPTFPKGDKVINLNTGETLQDPGNTGKAAIFPVANAVEPVLLGFPSDILPPQPELPATKPLVPDSSNTGEPVLLGVPADSLPPQPELPVTKPLVPGTSNTDEPVLLGFPADSLPPPSELPVTKPLVPGTSNTDEPVLLGFPADSLPPSSELPANTPLVPGPSSTGEPVRLGFPADNLPPQQELPVIKPLVPDFSIPISSGGNQPDVEAKPKPSKPTIPVVPVPNEPVVPSDLSMKPVPGQLIPVDQFVPTDTSGRPITMIPVDLMTPEKTPEQNPFVNPTPNAVRPGGRKSQNRRADPNQIYAKWMEIYPDGRRPDKVKAVPVSDVQDIAPPTPDQAMLSHISLVNYGKDRGMRRRLREQIRNARKERRRQRKQARQNRGRTRNAGGRRQGNTGNRVNRGQSRPPRGRNVINGVNRGSRMGRRGT